MKSQPHPFLFHFIATILLIAALHQPTLQAQPQDFDGPPPGFGGPPPGGPDGFVPGPGGPGGMMNQEIKILSQFDADKDGMLNVAERKAAREHLAHSRTEGRGSRGRFGPPGGPGGPGGPASSQEPKQPGIHVSPSDVTSAGDKPFYDPMTLRTLFLDFENKDWEKELSDFHGTDVDVPARLTVDGKVYEHVGVHFRGMSSYMMVGEGSKRSFNLSLDAVHKKQNIGGYRTLNLMNSHEDPSMLRAVLSYEIERDYIPAPKANFVRVVINGENWGIYANVQQFNKDFTREWFGTTGGARWKVRGNPGAQGSLAYLGEDPEKYKQIYTIKTKDDPKRWADFIKLCKILNETPPDQLETILPTILDVQGALKFIALDNALINNDGYWIRTSDYSIYEDEQGRFHILPQDSNETFVKPGGPGMPGGGGPGGRGRGPGLMLAPEWINQGDRNQDHNLTEPEFIALSEIYFDRLDPEKTGRVSSEDFSTRWNTLSPSPAPERQGPPGGGRGMGPGRMIAPALFTLSDTDKDGVLTRSEWKSTFARWFKEWDTDQKHSLDQDKISNGLNAALPRPNLGGPGGENRRGGPGGGPGGPRGPGGNMPQIKGLELDPLIAAQDNSKPLISKLLAVPAWRKQYLTYVKDIATRWLDWNKLGTTAQRYHQLIAEQVQLDTRKLDSTEDFNKSLTQDIAGQGMGMGPGGGGTISLKNFADQRRQYLLSHPEIQKLTH